MCIDLSIRASLILSEISSPNSCPYFPRVNLSTVLGLIPFSRRRLRTILFPSSLTHSIMAGLSSAFLSRFIKHIIPEFVRISTKMRTFQSFIGVQLVRMVK
jgi:hypothetical protein